MGTCNLNSQPGGLFYGVVSNTMTADSLTHMVGHVAMEMAPL
jgi:hypothetical protein